MADENSEAQSRPALLLPHHNKHPGLPRGLPHSGCTNHADARDVGHERIQIGQQLHGHRSAYTRVET